MPNLPRSPIQTRNTARTMQDTGDSRLNVENNEQIESQASVSNTRRSLSYDDRPVGVLGRNIVEDTTLPTTASTEMASNTNRTTSDSDIVDLIRRLSDKIDRLEARVQNVTRERDKTAESEVLAGNASEAGPRTQKQTPIFINVPGTCLANRDTDNDNNRYHVLTDDDVFGSAGAVLGSGGGAGGGGVGSGGGSGIRLPRGGWLKSPFEHLTFRGKDDKQNPELFVRDFENIAREEQVPEQDQLFYFKRAMKSCAKYWYEMTKPDDIQTAKDKFREYYWGREAQTAYKK